MNTLKRVAPGSKFFALFLVFGFSFAMTQTAWALQIKSPLPLLQVDNAGEVVLINKKPKFVSWSSTNLTNDVTLLQVLSASQEAADLNMPFLDKFSDHFETDFRVSSATIIISKKIPSLFSGFIKSELKKNKKQHPRAIMVNDKKGVTLEAWELPETQAIILLVDAAGIVQKYHEGKIPEQDEDQWIEHINQLLQTRQQDPGPLTTNTSGAARRNQ